HGDPEFRGQRGHDCRALPAGGDVERETGRGCASNALDGGGRQHRHRATDHRTVALRLHFPVVSWGAPLTPRGSGFGYKSDGGGLAAPGTHGRTRRDTARHRGAPFSLCFSTRCTTRSSPAFVLAGTSAFCARWCRVLSSRVNRVASVLCLPP